LGKPYLRLREPKVEQDLDGCFRRFVEAWEQVRDCWASGRDVVVDLLQTHPDINRRSYTKTVIGNSVSALDEFLRAAPRAVALCKNFERFTYATLRDKGIKPGGQCPEHKLFELCDALAAAVEAWERLLALHLAAFRVRALQVARDELASLKRRRQLQSFDDLL